MVTISSYLTSLHPRNFKDKPPIEKLESRLIDDNAKLVAESYAEARKESKTGLGSSQNRNGSSNDIDARVSLIRL